MQKCNPSARPFVASLICLFTVLAMVDVLTFSLLLGRSISSWCCFVFVATNDMYFLGYVTKYFSEQILLYFETYLLQKVNF